MKSTIGKLKRFKRSSSPSRTAASRQLDPQNPIHFVRAKRA
jgi:hypothetical protein